MRYHVGIGCSFGYSEHNVHRLLAEKLDADFINLSLPGHGNFRIYTELLYWVSSNKNKLSDTTFSIGWSGIYRNDTVKKSPNDHTFEWTRWRADRDDPTNKNLPEDADVQLDHTWRFLTFVLSLQNLLKNNRCRYIMYNGIDTYTDRSVFTNGAKLRLKVLEKQIDHKAFYEFKTSHSKFVADNKYFLDPRPVSLTDQITNWPSDDSQYAVADAHPSVDGDAKWAELLWKYCKDNQIL